MPRFKIINELPNIYREQIIDLWQKYLPGTPQDRLEWMENNPAGPAIWLLAIDESSGELAGTLSIFPKKLFFKGKEIKAGILGDFMLHDKYRVFGPTLNLFNSAKAFVDKQYFDFLYTIPNIKSKKIAEKVGFHQMLECISLACPHRLDFTIKKHLGSSFSKMLELPFLLFLKAFSRTTYIKSSGHFNTISSSEKEFNGFCQNLSEIRSQRMYGEHNFPYLKWRYLQNPAFEFQIMTYKPESSGNIAGFFIFTIYNHRLELYDFDATDVKTSLVMLKKLGTLCKSAKCRGIYTALSSNNPLLSIIKQCCFFNTKDTYHIYTYPKEISGINSWFFFSADKNV